MKKRIPELDGLRGIAILLVISFHYLNNQLINNESNLARIIARITSFGWTGVDLFFVLSGFLIGSILIRTRDSGNYFKTFFIRRLLRIIPNYYLFLFIYLVINSIAYFDSNYFLTGNNLIPFWSYFAMLHNLFMASLRNLGNDSISVTWSIGIEEQFYLLFPFLLFFIRRKWIPVLLLILIIMAPVFREQFDHWIPPYVLLYCRMDALAFGILVAYINEKGYLQDILKKYSFVLLSLLLLSILTCIALFIAFNDLGVLRNTLLSIIFSIGIVFALAEKDSIFRRFLRNNVLGWIGTVSYSLYLFHYLILGLSHHIAGRRDGIGIYDLKDVIISFIALISSIVFAWVVYKKIEGPLVGLGKKYTY